MGYIIAFILATIFLVGLIQWAQGGADLWRIFRLKRREKFLSREEVIEAENEVKKLEQSADRTIGASFRIIAVLAVIVWVMLGITMILDLLGINWVSSLQNRQPVPECASAERRCRHWGSCGRPAAERCRWQ